MCRTCLTSVVDAEMPICLLYFLHCGTVDSDTQSHVSTVTDFHGGESNSFIAFGMCKTF